MVARAAAGLIAAAVVAVAARRARSLSTSGAVAAAAVGTAAVAAGWGWGLLLVTYFVASVSLSRAGAAAKEARTGPVVDKGGRRDAAQVLANGGVFALAALLSPALPAAGAAALGALASATADTWATEIGTLSPATPRSLLTWRRVPPGTSGGVSIPGTAALLAGAVFIAALSRLLGLTHAVAAIVAAGVVGAMTDSVLGATLQERRWCDACDRATERRTHDCGTPTSLAGGLPWLDNDAVNLAATLAGAGTATLLWLPAARP